jgi:glycosyltransferase involved in cell wall biosynthesis
MEPSFALCFSSRLSKELDALGTPSTILGPLRTRFAWQVWRARRRLEVLLKEQTFDVVICRMAWTHAIFGPVVRRAKLPLVFWMCDAAQGNQWIERWARLCPPDLAICNSRFTASTLRRLFADPLPRHEIIHAAVAKPSTIATAAERAALRAELQTPSEACVIMQAGRMEPYKGATLHLDALGRLADLPGWVCWMIGGAQRPHEAAYVSDLKRRASKMGIADRVRFLGERRNVPRFLQAADIFCQPNLQPEPFGMVFVEALYAGLPVVSTAFGGVLEIVDETTSRLVPPGCPEALAGALRELVLEPSLRRQLGLAGPARADRLSSPGVILPKLEGVLRDFLRSASPQGFAGDSLEAKVHSAR